jgi:RND family efflux transporter MFP subunit
VLSLTSGCERDPGVSSTGGSGSMPVLVGQATRGPFVVERRFPGRVCTPGELRVMLREAGEVVSVAAPADSTPVRSGQVLLELRSEDLELEIEEAETVLTSSEVEVERLARLVELGLAARTELDAGRTDVDQARVRLERLRLRSARLTVTAPADGVLVHRAMPEPGQWCTVGEEVARVVDPDSAVVEVVVPASWSAHAREVGQAVLELGDAGETGARVVTLSADVDPERGGRVLTLRSDSAAALVPGAVVGVRLVVSARDAVVTVPAGAVVSDGSGGWRVAVGPAAGEEGTVRWTAVVPGASDGSRTVVEEGLEAGIWVVVAGELSTTGWWGYDSYLGVGR